MILLKYILKNTDIFDDEFAIKINKVVAEDKDRFTNEKAYELIISFHVNALKDPRFEEHNLPVPCKREKITISEKIHAVLSFQLKETEKLLEKKGIEIYSSSIRGDNIESENIVKIEIIEDTEQIKERAKVSCIVPNVPYIQDVIRKFLELL